jgi:hypothetical protein
MFHKTPDFGFIFVREATLRLDNAEEGKELPRRQLRLLLRLPTPRLNLSNRIDVCQRSLHAPAWPNSKELLSQHQHAGDRISSPVSAGCANSFITA